MIEFERHIIETTDLYLIKMPFFELAEKNFESQFFQIKDKLIMYKTGILAVYYAEPISIGQLFNVYFDSMNLKIENYKKTGVLI